MTVTVIYATLGRIPRGDLLAWLEAKAADAAHDLYAQSICSILWALATLGEKPSVDLLQLIDARAVAVAEGFRPPETLMFLWAYACFAHPRSFSFRRRCQNKYPMTVTVTMTRSQKLSQLSFSLPTDVTKVHFRFKFGMFANLPVFLAQELEPALMWRQHDVLALSRQLLAPKLLKC